jgi:hypothetical protein
MTLLSSAPPLLRLPLKVMWAIGFSLALSFCAKWARVNERFSELGVDMHEDCYDPPNHRRPDRRVPTTPSHHHHYYRWAVRVQLLVPLGAKHGQVGCRSKLA